MIFFLLFSPIFAETVNFKEEKFVEALALYTYRDGNVSYDDKKTVVKYKDGKTIVKIDNNVTVYDKKDKLLTTINLNEKPDIALYFNLTKALFQKDFESLKETFEIKKPKSKKFHFLPKDDVEKFIEYLDLYLKEDDSISSFVLKFTNGDKINIEEK